VTISAPATATAAVAFDALAIVLAPPPPLSPPLLS